MRVNRPETRLPFLSFQSPTGLQLPPESPMTPGCGKRARILHIISPFANVPGGRHEGKSVRVQRISERDERRNTRERPPGDEALLRARSPSVSGRSAHGENERV